MQHAKLVSHVDTDLVSGTSGPSSPRGDATFTETTRVHEDNHTYIGNDHLYMDHDEETSLSQE